LPSAAPGTVTSFDYLSQKNPLLTTKDDSRRIFRLQPIGFSLAERSNESLFEWMLHQALSGRMGGGIPGAASWIP
jgi:hypothetical protein